RVRSRGAPAEEIRFGKRPEPAVARGGLRGVTVRSLPAGLRLKLAYPFDRAGLLGALMLAPAVLYILALVAIPLVLAVVYAFSDVKVGDQSINLVGFENFRNVWRDPVFRESLKNTVLFTLISQTIVIVLAKTLALALAADFRGKWLLRFLILLPWTTPIALG